MGDPQYVAGLPYDVGTCGAGGVSNLLYYPSVVKGFADDLEFDARPSGFSCPSASKIQSYCDATDPYCCNGNDASTHNGYGAEYGQAALTFVNTKLSSTGTGTGGGGGTSSGTVAK
jgi:acetylxylan esterase